MDTVKKQGFVKGASILLGSMIVVKMMGAIFKIPIGNILTPVGMAYFNTSYQLFTTVYALTVTGFSAATARMVAAFSAESAYQDCKRTLRITQIVFLILGVIGAILMVIFSDNFTGLVKMPHAQYAMMAMAPAVFFSCLMASYRGYYEGLNNMTPTAISQIVEVFIKLVLGIVLSYSVIEYARRQFMATNIVFGVRLATIEDAISLSLPYAAAATMIGISISTLGGFLYMMFRFKMSSKDHLTLQQQETSPAPSCYKQILCKLLITALPVTLSAVALNLTNMIDVITITTRLKTVYMTTPDYFNQLYGQYLSRGQQIHELIYGSYTYALPFFSIISAFTSLFGKSALPNVTTAFVRQDKILLRTNIESILRMTALISFPAGVGLYVLSEDIILFFHGNIAGATILIAPALKALGIAAIFLGFTSPMYAIFQGMGKFFLPLIFVLIGGIMKTIINYYLIGITSINIKGAAYGSLICYGIIIVLSLFFLNRVSGLKINYLMIFCKPAIAAFVCGLTAKYFSSIIAFHSVAFIVTLLISAISYLLIVFLLRTIPKSELLMLPKGETLTILLIKFHLLPK